MNGAAWRTRALCFRYPRADTDAVADVRAEIGRGQFTAVLGPNGSGKSTLLRLLLGVLAPTAGEVEFRGKPVRSWPRRRMAQEVGVVPQQEEIGFPLSVRELVAMGRYPFLGSWRAEGPADAAAIDAALDRCDIAPLRDRPLSTLSGGERQRARIARALAQEPRALILDEPTVSLDVRHEMAIFELLRALTAEGVTVLVVTHHLNLAARYADRLLLMDRGRLAAAGTPAEVFDKSLLERVYGWTITVVPHPGPGSDAGAPQVVPLATR